jgi:hypothetical protein
MLVVGIILAVIGYKIYRLELLPGIPSNKRNMWIVILVILLAVVLLAEEVYTSIALVVPLVGLVLMPSLSVIDRAITEIIFMVIACVAILALIGIVLALIGILLRRRSEEGREEEVMRILLSE